MSDKFGCVGNTIRLRSGHWFDIAKPRAEDFTWGDIAGAVSKICRFGSQSRWYSVAEHLIHCYQQSLLAGWGPLASRLTLLHDASEAFIGDCVKPLKNLLPAYSAIEEKIERVIFDKYGIPRHGLSYCYEHHVKPIDRAMLIWEKRWAFDDDGVVWEGQDLIPPCPIEFMGYSPDEAEFWLTYCAEQAGIDTTR